MTLDELFARINGDYATVRSIANSIYEPVKTQVDSMHYSADYYAKRAIAQMFVSTTDMARSTAHAAQYIVWELNYFVNEMYKAVSSARSGIKSIFSTYLPGAVANVQNAIALVQSNMYKEVAYLTEDIDQSIDYIQGYLDTEIATMQNEMDSLSENMLAWISEEVEALTTAMDDRITEVTQNFEASIEAVNLYITESNAEIYGHIELRDAEMMEQIMLVSDSLFDYINKQVDEINDTMENMLRAISWTIATEVNRLDETISSVSISLTAKINELVEATTWQYSFFDIFTFRPELSLLRVLLRSEADFEQYKPYWQALFARILAED